MRKRTKIAIIVSAIMIAIFFIDLLLPFNQRLPAISLVLIIIIIVGSKPSKSNGSSKP